jgi:hypothetical protein
MHRRPRRSSRSIDRDPKRPNPKPSVSERSARKRSGPGSRALLAELDRVVEQRLDRARARWATKPLEDVLVALTRVDQDWGLGEPIDDPLDPGHFALPIHTTTRVVLGRERERSKQEIEADRATKQTAALSRCARRHIAPEPIALIGVWACTRVAAEEFRRTILQMLTETSPRWADFRAHSTLVLDLFEWYVDSLIPTLSGDALALRHDLAMAVPLLRIIEPHLHHFTSGFPPGTYRGKAGRPGRKQARDEANHKLDDRGVDATARAWLLSAWGLGALDESKRAVVDKDPSPRSASE